MRTFLVVVLAVVVFAVAIAALAPASLVAPAIERATRNRVAITETDGKLWHGRGVVTAGGVRVPVTWDVDALPLLTGAVSARITPGEANATTPRAQVDASANRVVLRNLDVVVPANVVQQAALRNAPIKPGWSAEGEIALASPRMVWTPDAYDGDLDVVWRGARLNLVSTTPVDLGELTAQLAAVNGRLAGPVRNRGGNLDVRGDVAFAPDGALNASLVLTPRRIEDTELARALAQIGTPEGAGYRVSWQTTRR